MVISTCNETEKSSIDAEDDAICPLVEGRAGDT